MELYKRKMNILEKLFNELNQKKIDYCILRKYENLPNQPNGDVDLAVNKQDSAKVLSIIKNLKFIFYPYTKPHYFFFFYDKEIGLVKLDLVLLKNLPKLKKFKNFYVPMNNVDVRLKKGIFSKIQTNLQRKWHYLFRGKLICFIGPDGSGKSTLMNKTFEALEEFPLKKKKVYFGSKKGGKLYRIFDLKLKLLKVYLNLFLGRMIFTDRYIYLTFRKNKALMNLVRFFAPQPNIVFVMKASPESIHKRKKELSVDEINEQYELFANLKNVVEISTESKIKDCLLVSSNKILELYKK
jgi:thymidylate kinase